MSTASAAEREEPSCFQIKGSVLTVVVLHVLNPDLDRLGEQLARKVQQSPGLFRGMPVLLNLQAVQEQDHEVDIARLVLLLGDQGLVPVGLRHGSDAQREAARHLGLAVLPDRQAAPAPKAEPRTDAPVPEPAPAQPQTQATPLQRAAMHPAGSPARVVTQSVRSGQQIYAEGGDLIVLASVSPGAEILADGNIHVYGALHGRALAGVQGDEGTRVFCRKLYAELISIAGVYRVYEDLDPALLGQPAQVYLHQHKMVTEPL